MLQLKEIKKNYVTASETVEALKGLTLSFRQREFVSILGPSGCGKTTLLNIIGGLDHYTSGDLSISGVSTKSYTDRDWDVYRNHRIGFIFQSYNLIPHQTVLGNVELALTISGVSREERIAKAKSVLDRVGLAGQYYKKPNQLSGGQCQRVAIARALVNDPEILLADEPTGALDTQTSVQIMNLIREIAGERLVIMVTHNPELAQEYSTRIVRLLDGRLLEDTNPMTEEEEARESAEREALARAETEKLSSLDEKEKKAYKKQALRKKEKAKMSFFTAFRLSARNLLSKKGRTAMVGIAGSIGIVGIALVLAFSAGIKGYIASMQDDMLSGNPIEIAETAYDFNALTGMMKASDVVEIIKQDGRVYVSSLVEYLAKMGKDLETLVVENTLTKEYIDYVKAMPEEYYNAMLLDYGIDLNSNLYTDFEHGGKTENISVSALTSIYSSILQETEFKDYASLIGTLAPSFSQLPSNPEYILSQYNLVGEGSKIAEGKNEIMLVLNSEDELSDLLLARFGFYSQEEFLEIVYKATEEKYNEEVYRDSFAYDELIGKTFTWYPNDTAFSKQAIMPGYSVMTHNYKSDNFSDEGSVELKVVGILTPKDTVQFGSVSSGIYYTSALLEHIMSANAGCEFFKYIESIDESNSTTAALMNYYIPYSYSYNYDANRNGVDDAGESKTVTGYISPAMSMEDMMGSMMGGSQDKTAFDHSDMKERMLRSYGGNDMPNSVKIYPVSFDEKDLVTSYLDAWNDSEEHADVTYTDALELIITMINTMIDVVSYALIAFTSVSLVVSTVMIGIITYVSVVERIKEIGVIRSLGGRKKDVSHLFNAETFIIGLLAGLIGVGATYLISVAVNLILKPLIGYGSIAALPVGQAVILILLSIGLTLISGLIPASSAAKKDPVVALRTE
jgi:putative ABC transport system permease protein